MKKIILVGLFCTLIGSCSLVRAQEKAKTEDGEKKQEAKSNTIPLRAQITVAEYEGEKKISSLPYTLLMKAESNRGNKASIRMGLRVPVATGISGGNTQYTYIDVGTNLDAWASTWDDGRFAVHLGIEKSSAYLSRSDGKSTPIATNEMSVTGAQPVVQQFKSEVDLFIRDGQTVQSTLATDPLSGRVTKVEVTVNVMK
jgi:hypothetical protein